LSPESLGEASFLFPFTLSLGVVKFLLTVSLGDASCLYPFLESLGEVIFLLPESLGEIPLSLS